MKVADVMTTEVKTIEPDAPLKEAAMVMVRSGVSGLPVVDDDRKVVGIITEADFVTAEANRSWGRQRRRLLANLFGEAETHEAKTVGDAMTPDPATIDRNSSVTEAARTMTDLGVKRLPVVLGDGTIEGIVSRADVMAAFARADDELAAEIRDDVVLGVLQLHDADIDVEVRDGVVALRGVVPRQSDARLLEELTVRVEGVVSVDAEVSWEHDDAAEES
ncbi:MAG: CBS domain-containing protein [Acidimicrobiia bacterium]|nr:CBS domain-containing protein [Acidimicrobiia bacterium]